MPGERDGCSKHGKRASASEIMRQASIQETGFDEGLKGLVKFGCAGWWTRATKM